MNRYVIVCVIKGSCGDFNNALRKDVLNKFQAKSSSLPAHFTIKAPFECNDISIIKDVLNRFSKENLAYPLKIEGYNHFDNRVIYMPIDLSQEAKEVHDKLIDVLTEYANLKFKDSEGKNKIFHITVASKKIQSKFEDIWRYVDKIPCSFSGYFDNITLYQWIPYRWKMIKEYPLNRCDQ